MLTFPHLVIHCSTEFYTHDILAENLFLKRKYSILEGEHAAIKQKHAKLEHDVEHFKRLMSQLLASFVSILDMSLPPPPIAPVIRPVL